jgi:MoaA/NifB/PqqE/SkfB family radical SAM enzyme
MIKRYSDAHVPVRKRTFVTTRADGSLIIPAELARRYGLAPGEILCIEALENEVLLHQPVTHLAKVYLEPTNDCPFSCRTCMRNSWNEPKGQMEEKVFARVVEGLRTLPVAPSVFFGGIGEPLSHSGTLTMIRHVKAAGAETQMITNGLALNEATVESLVDMKLDALWVSLDGATQECYEDVRQASALPSIVENLRMLKEVKYRRDARRPELGIAFVAMKRNRAELSRVIDLGLRLGATRFSLSNIHPYTEALRDEIVYERTLGQSLGAFSRLDLARMDSGGEWDHAIAGILADCGLRYSNGRAAAREEDTCPFVENCSTSIRWDGRVSPCLPLLHSHFEYLGDRRRTIEEFSFGSIAERSLLEIWNDPEYVAFRQRLQRFDFPPCLRCNSCDMADSNKEDCFGSRAPTCGACAWAQGFVVCP